MSLKDQPIAEYVLQVNTVFRPKTVNVLGSLQVWRKGALFGFGDDLMRFCPSHGCLGTFNFVFALTDSEIERVDGEDHISKWPADIKARHDNWYHTMVTCPKCHVSSPRALLADSYGFNLPLNKIASKMARLFGELDRNADIYMVRTKEDRLFHKAKEHLHSQDFNRDHYNKLVEKARDRDQILYPLHKVIKDAHSGSVQKRFLAMLRA
jgi:hypothetical protein